MGLRVFGGAVAVAIGAYALVRYKRGQLRRGELLLVVVVCTTLMVAGVAPQLLDPFLRALGFEPGGERRIIGLLVVSNLLVLALLFRGFSRDDQLSDEVGRFVDALALRRFRSEEARPSRESLRGSCAVVLPAYNEEDNLPAVLAALPREIHGLEVRPIVVADGCTDRTEQVARDLGASVISRDLRRGSGAAVRLGYLAAVALRARVIVTMDADGQHDPREMKSLVEPLLAGRADMVQGSRILGSSQRDSRIRHLGVLVFGKLLSLLAARRITDPSTGYRAMTAEALSRLDLRQDQFYVSEVILDATRKGLTVLEVPVTMHRRGTGLSKKPPSLRYAWGFGKAMLRTWLR